MGEGEVRVGSTLDFIEILMMAGRSLKLRTTLVATLCVWMSQSPRLYTLGVTCSSEVQTRARHCTQRACSSRCHLEECAERSIRNRRRVSLRLEGAGREGQDERTKKGEWVRGDHRAHRAACSASLVVAAGQ